MLTVSDVSLNFSGQNLFSHVNLKFTPGNCYGVIGANGAGKSTFLRILSGELEPSKGEVILDERSRMSVLKQDHFAYDAYSVLDTVIMGNPRLYEISTQKEQLYAKDDFTEEDGILASELESEFAELGGWDAPTEAQKLLQGLGLGEEVLYESMSSLPAKLKVKVLLAQALFGQPDIILLDEPTNHLDYGNQLRALSMVRALVKRGFGVIMTSHNPDHVLLLGGQVGILGNDGRFLVGNAEEVMTEERLRALYRSDLYLTYVERVGRKVCIPGRLKSDE